MKKYLIFFNSIIKILKLNGIYNLNPYECSSAYIFFIKQTYKKEKRIHLSLKLFLKIFLINFRSINSVYKKFFESKSIKNKIDFNVNNILINYEDSSNNKLHDKYYGNLKKILAKETSKSFSEIHIDVLGAKSTNKSILSLVSYIDAFFIFFISQLIFIFLLIILLLPKIEKYDFPEKLYCLEMLSQPLILRLLFWEFAFFKLFKKSTKKTSFVYLAEGASWEWIMLNNCPKENKISGYIHAIARPDQYSLYSSIKTFSKTKNLSILLSDIWSLDRLKKYCPNNLSIVKVENLRFFTTLEPQIKKNNNYDICVIGGLDGDLSKNLIANILLYIKKRKIENINLVVKEHPDNKEIYPTPRSKFIIDSSNIDFNQVIINSKVIIVSGYSAACIDVNNLNKKCFIYLPKGYLDLCPLPKNQRNLISSNNDLFRILSDLKKINEDSIYFENPFFYKENKPMNWLSFLK